MHTFINTTLSRRTFSITMLSIRKFSITIKERHEEHNNAQYSDIRQNYKNATFGIMTLIRRTFRLTINKSCH
jgi:hypothetical protein